MAMETKSTISISTYSDGLYEMTVGSAFKLFVVLIKFEDQHCPHGFGGILCPPMFGMIEQILRAALFDNDATVHYDNGGCHFQRKFDFMRNDNHGPAFCANSFMVSKTSCTNSGSSAKSVRQTASTQAESPMRGQSDPLLTAGKLVVEINFIA